MFAITTNKDKQRDPEMSSTKKGTTWIFGMKAHISVDVHSGLIHTVGVTTAKTHDAKVIEHLIHKGDRSCSPPLINGWVNEKLKKAARQAQEKALLDTEQVQ